MMLLYVEQQMELLDLQHQPHIMKNVQYELHQQYMVVKMVIDGVGRVSKIEIQCHALRGSIRHVEMLMDRQ